MIIKKSNNLGLVFLLMYGLDMFIYNEYEYFYINILISLYAYRHEFSLFNNYHSFFKWLQIPPSPTKRQVEFLFKI